jgi:hypothetical protein
MRMSEAEEDTTRKGEKNIFAEASFHKQLRCYRTSLLNIWQWGASRAREHSS